MPGQYIQCFLFIAHKGPIPSLPESDVSTPPVRRSEIVAYALLPSGEDYGYIYDIFNIVGITIIRDARFDPFLVEAVKSDQVELVELLIDKEMVDARDHLLLNVDEFNEDIVKKVLLGYHIVTHSFFWELSSTSEADRVMSGDTNWSIIKQLISHGTEIRHRNEDGGTFLYFAIQRKESQLVSLLLDNGAPANAKIHSYLSPLHMAVICHAHVSILDILLRHGADVNDTTSKSECAGATPLLLALEGCFCFFRPPDLVNYLLENGADVDVESSSESVLQLAVKCDQEVLACVLKHIPNLNTPRNQEVCRYALQNWREDHQITQVRSLVDHGFRLYPDDAKNVNLFSRAIRVDSPALVKDLLKWGASVYHSGDVVKDALKKELERRKRYKNDSCYDSVRIFLELEDPWCSELRVFILKQAIELENELVIADILGYMNPHIFFTYFWNKDRDFDEEAEKGEFQRAIIQHAVFFMVTWDLDFGNDPIRMLKRIGMWSESKAKETDILCRTIGDSNLALYAILNASDLEVVRLLNDKTIIQVLKEDKFCEDFLFASSIISKRFRKAYYQKTLKEEGIRMFNFVSKDFRKIPDELKLIIIDYLSNIDLLIFTNMCDIPSEYDHSLS